MKSFITISILLVASTAISCSLLPESSLEDTHDSIQKKEQTLNTSTGAHNLEDTTYFSLVQNFIKDTGEKFEFDISSSLAHPHIMTSYNVRIDSVLIYADHTDRIYMMIGEKAKDGTIYAKTKLGNILKEKGMIRPEIIYGVPDKNPEETKIKEGIVLKYYEKLINIALQNKRN